MSILTIVFLVLAILATVMATVMLCGTGKTRRKQDEIAAKHQKERETK